METIESRRIKFGVLLSLQIPSIACYLGLIYHITSNRVTLRALHNHAPLVLLFVGLITVIVDLSMILNFLRTGIVNPSTDVYCRIWNFIDLLLYALVSILMLWTSVERHILIFHHHQLLNTERKCFFGHYFPYCVIFGYLILFYTYIAFIHSCENHFDYYQVVCAGLCFVYDPPALGVFDQFAHTVIPSILIVILNLGLWFRVLWQKHHRMRRTMEWRQHRKMILQFLPVSILYSCGYLPFGFVQCYQAINGPTNLSLAIQQLYFFYLFYLIGTLHPFACLIGMPEIYWKWFCRRNPRVIPTCIQQKHKRNKVAATAM
ncbi:unnamed protein product [Rotaria sp. Silwood2]|nr:unnamed protein product [Rotaria sp. Silwood2]